VELWQTSNLRRLRLGEEKKKEEDRRNHGKNIMSAFARQGAYNEQKQCHLNALHYTAVYIIQNRRAFGIL